MKMPSDINNIDIWGESLEDKKECFACGITYVASSSTAPPDYKTTYCSDNCYTFDRISMERAILAGKAATAKEPTIEYEVKQVGDFKLKVKKES
jgi:hypothetical protein